MEYTISYGGKTFNDRIFGGVFTAEADSIETVQEGAFGMIQRIKIDNQDDDNIPWHNNIQNIQITVSEKQDL